MKKFFTPLIALLFTLPAISQTTYPGNGKTGFGGPVGTGSLAVDITGSILTVKLNRGTGNMNDALVIYIDAGTGGFSNTGSFMDASTPLKRAISGFDGGANRSVLNFTSSFMPGYALALMPNNSEGAIFVQLNSTFHIPLGTPPLTNNGNTSATDYSVSIDLSAIGVTGSFSFKFVGTLISGTGYRSNEAIGLSMDGFTEGWNPYTQSTPALVYNATFPVVLSEFTGVLKGSTANLNWSTKSESNSKAFNIEKSSNGGEYVTIGSVASYNRTAGSSYNFKDDKATDRINYYRLKMVDQDGKFTYSNTIKLSTTTKAGITVLGNPVKGSFNVNIKSDVAATYNLELISIEGKRISSLTYRHSPGTNSATITVPAGTRGAYILKASNGLEVETIPVLIQ